MSEMERANDLYELDKITRELNQVFEKIRSIKEQMIKFAYALDMSPTSIGFTERSVSRSQENNFEFNYRELKDEIFDIEKLKKILLKVKELSDKKQKLEEKLGIRIALNVLPQSEEEAEKQLNRFKF